MQVEREQPYSRAGSSKLLNGKWDVRVASIICLPEKQPLSRQPCE